ncbi:MAG: hypothetical protein HY304_02895 [candidate division Zixibacteria bacterium]|nr:hypothetical protein [candidate division Zixibacteria bacterium]
MGCDGYDDLIDRVDLLEPTDRARLIEHAKLCPECRGELLESHHLRNTLRRAFSFAPDAKFWKGFYVGVRRLMHTRSDRAGKPAVRRSAR